MSDIRDKIERLGRFKGLIADYRKSRSPQLRSEINQEATWVRQQVIEARCFRTYTVAPPPILGGLVMQDLDAFSSMFNPPYDTDLFSEINDMIDRTIGVLKNGGPVLARTAKPIVSHIREGYAFIAMAINDANPALADTLDAIKEAAKRCGIQAERIDEAQ